jgi:phage-related protein
MTQPLETAFVELRPIGEKDFKKRVEKILDDTVKSTDEKMNEVSKTIEQTFDQAADDVFKSFDRVNHSLNATLEIIDRDMVDSVREFRTEINALDRDSNRTFSRMRSIAAKVGDVFDHVKDTVSDLFKRLRTAGGNATDSLTSGLTSLGSAIGGLVASTLNPASLIAFGTTLLAITALAPVVLALAAALAQLGGALLALPAVGGVAVAALAPLIVAFQGFGEAIGAIIEKDPEKINEALKNLTPSARSVAREFEKLFPALERFQDLVQESFFVQLRGSLTALAGNLLPTLTTGFTNVASAIGNSFAQLGEVFEGDVIEGIGDAFESTVRIINTLSPSVIDLFGTLFGVMEHGLPFVERMATAVAEVIDAFSEWLTEKLQTGEFEQFLENSFRVMGELVTLATELGRLLVAIFAPGADEGEDFIVTLTEATTKLADFFESVEGQQALDDLYSLVILVGDGVMLLVDAFLFGAKAIDAFNDFMYDVGVAAGELEVAIDDAWASLMQFFEDLGAWLGRVADGFAELPGKIAEFVESIPERVEAIFTAMFDRLFIIIGQGIGVILYLFTQLPADILRFISGLPTTVAKIFADMWLSVQDTTTTKFAEIEAFIVTIPERIRTAISSVNTFVSDIFSSAVENARMFFVNGFNAIIAFVGGVPKRIGDAFRSAGSFVSDVAGDIANAVRSVVNRAIDRINQGIATIDDVLPGSLGRIPRLAAGAIARQPSITGEAGPEANIPLTDPRAMNMLRDALGIGDGGVGGGQMINIAAGAVVVSFNGAVPTETEAFRTGQAVVDGMTDAFSRRNVRTQVRAA